MKRLLVGVEDAVADAAPLSWAANVAESTGAELVAVSAWEPEQIELPPEEYDWEHAERRDSLRHALESLPGNRARRAEVIDGSAADVVLEQGQDEHADVVVVGTHGRAGSPVRVGGVVDAMVRRTVSPLAVIPRGAAAEVRRIVLGVDGSPGSTAAAKWCAGLAAEMDAEVIAVSVYTQQLEVVPETDPRGVYEYFQHALDNEWTAPLREAGVQSQTILVRNPHAVDGLVQSATDRDAHAIVVGTHRRARMTHRRLGGMAIRLLHAASIPVVLVPAV
jgi:nucleotide-binding universal stress UspA family protein